MADTDLRRTRIAVILMLVSFLLGMVVALGSLKSMGGHLDSDVMTSSPFNVPTVLIGLLTPWAIVLEVVAVILVLLDGLRVGGLQKKMALTALWFLIVWGVANVGGFLPLTFVALQRGSLGMLRAGQMVKALAAVLQYSIPFLLVFGIAGPGVRKLLWSGLALTVIGNFTTVALGGAAMTLRASEAGGVVSYVPSIAVDYTSGIYPATLIVGYAGGLLYIVAYAILLSRGRLR